MNRLMKGFLGVAAFGATAAIGAKASKVLAKSQPLPKIPGALRTTVKSPEAPVGSKAIPVDIQVIGDTALITSALPRNRFNTRLTATAPVLRRWGLSEAAITELKGQGLKDSVEQLRDYPAYRPRTPQEINEFIRTLDLGSKT